jgi:hypothetical protein
MATALEAHHPYLDGPLHVPLEAFTLDGIREYWLVDARGPWIDFRILVHGRDGYEPAARQGAWQASPVFGRRFKLQRRRNADGFWSYSLSMSR